MRNVAGPDAGFLSAERPEWPFHVSALLVLDAAQGERFSLDALRTQLLSRLHRVPQFRWKIRDDVLPFLTRPVWVDDADFDIDRHLHHIALPSPGDDRELARVVGDLVGIRLARTKPLWEMWLIDGLAEGHVALLAKIHHSIIDGESGVELVTLLFDVDADPDPEPPPPAWEPEPEPSTTDQLVGAASELVSWPVRTARLGWQVLRQGATYASHPSAEERGAIPFMAPRTPFNGVLTEERDFASAALDLERCQAVKRAAGVKLNDVVLAVVSGALRSYLTDGEALPDRPLIAQVPVSLRRKGPADHIGTKVAVMFAAIATDVADPAERLMAIHESTTRGKEMRKELDVPGSVGVTDTLPPGLIALAARQWTTGGLDSRMTPMFNVVVSNIAGSPTDLFVAGARIEAFYPMGPLVLGAGMNFTVVSNVARLDFGLLTCPALVPDPWDVVARLVPALDELAEVYGVDEA